MDCRATFYSSAMLFVEMCSFSCKFLFLWYFSDFQRLVLIDTKPSGGVVCHYCHNLGHVRQNCRKLQNKN